jgi:hypothetical protein
MIQERGRGQFLQVCEAKALQERFGCRKAQATVATRELFYEVQIPKLHNESTLVGVEESVDFCLVIGCLKAMKASTSSAEVARSEIPCASFCSLK